MVNLSDKISTYFRGNIIGKGLMRKAGLDFIPRYVSEFILGNYISDFEEEEAIRKAKNFVNKYFPEPNSSNLLRHKLLEEGKIKVLSKFEVNVDLHEETYWANIPIFREKILFDPHFAESYPALLTTGMWGLGTIMFKPSGDSNFKMELADFRPFQIGAFDFEEFTSARSQFSLTEWIDLLITSMGLNCHNLNTTQKVYILCRLLPLVRRNLNIAEFGPKSTGKTYIYRHHSSYTHVISGSAITPAKFIFDLSRNIPGLISTSDAIVFDEVTGAEFGKTQDYEMIGLLKDYMEGGYVSRGKKDITEDASLIYLGNIDVKGSQPKFTDYVRELPRAFSDPAFVDRINGIIPGWKIPKISQIEDSLTDDIGLMSNYLGEVFHYLRRYDHPSINWKQVDKNFGMVRNEKSVRKITEGMLVLLFPGVVPSPEEINFCLDIACSLRQNVYDQLNKLDSDEFPAIKISAKYIG